MLSLKFKLIRTERTVVVTVMTLSWLLFLVILLCFITRDTEKVSIKTIDMAYKALENFIFLSISGVFLFSQIEDFQSQRRHMLRVQIGLANSVYYLSHLVGDFVFYSILCIPSIIMVSLGFRQEELPYLSQGWHVAIEVISKISFGLILLPVVYLLGFLQRKNA